ncbi:unnamed protein product [Discula destructiva]
MATPSNSNPSAGRSSSSLKTPSQPDLIESAIPDPPPPKVDIKDLLRRLWPVPQPAAAAAPAASAPAAATASSNNVVVSPVEIADAIAHFFTDRVDDVQAGALLMCLHFTGLDRDPAVLSLCAQKMLRAAAPVDAGALRRVVADRGRKEGAYQGGFCDIVGTGGDAHNTFNISTTASIIASSLLLVAKHGNRASTSKSGSADLIANMAFPTPPDLTAIAPANIARLYARANYAFLFAPTFHPGMRFVSPVRKVLPWRTVFNLLGPLANPMDVVVATNPLPPPSPSSPDRSNDTNAPSESSLLEARVIGVARRDLGPVFAQSLALNNIHKAMVVCGAEDLDEVSCAGSTLCWRLHPPSSPSSAPQIDHFTLTPSDFGLSPHPLSTVSPGKEPAENAAILRAILNDELPDTDPILEFVLMNAAALFVVAGVCEADTSAMGPGDDGLVITERGPGGGRWKEGVRRARWAVKSGEAWRQWGEFVDATNGLGGQ